MITKIQGEKYSFEVVSEEQETDFCFCIKAIDKATGKFSCINNLNPVLSGFDIGTDDPRVEDSMWVVTKEESLQFEQIAKEFLSSPAFLEYLERRLAEDRMLGEWENIIPDFPFQAGT